MPEAKELRTEVLVIGAGPGGYVAAIRAGQLKKKVITSKEALEIPFIPKEMGVVGGGYVGMEMASVYHSLGSNVSVIEMLDLVCANADRQIAQLANQRFKRDGINLLTSTKVTGSKQTPDGKKELSVSGPQGEKKLTFELVMVA